jgi:hypothetical protein
MGFGKSFGFSLLTYVGMNFLFVIIAHTVSGDLNTLFSDITANPFIILLVLCGPIINFPGTVILGIYNGILGPLVPDSLIQSVGYIVSPFIAAIVAGRVGDKNGASFGGWFLTCILCALAIGLLVYLSPITLTYYAIVATTETLMVAMIGGITNGIFYGAFALLFTKTEYY